MRDPRVDALAKILVGYSTEVKEGEVVSIDGETAAAPLLIAVYEEVLKAGAHAVLNVALEGQVAAYFKHATDAQLEWIAKAKHASVIERPDQALALLRRFLLAKS